MGFVNETVSVEDAIRHQLDDIKRRASPQRFGAGLPSGFRHHWTIDRENRAFFLYLASVNEIGGADSRGQERFLLSVDGEHHDVVLTMGPGSSSDDNEPFRVEWQLISIDGKHDLKDVDISLLKLATAAISAYADSGIKASGSGAQTSANGTGFLTSCSS